VFVSRLKRALLLDAGLYTEVASDKSATGQAVYAVLLAGAASGLGMIATRGGGIIALETAATLLGWVVCAIGTYLVGVKLLPEARTGSGLGNMMRALGFAFSPGLIRIFSFIPYLGGAIVVASWIWTFAAVVVAVKRALDYSSAWRAAGVAVIGFALVILIVYALKIYVIMLLFAYGFRDA